MDAGIGPPRTHRRDGLVAEPGERLLNPPLNRVLVTLAGEAAEATPVVGEVDADAWQ